MMRKNAGNVLFIILLAVALFAALAYAVTNSTRSGGGDASREQSILNASQVMQFASSIETSIMRMKISNGCVDNIISFENPIVSGYTNSNAPSDYRCHVFRTQGGNMSWPNHLNNPTFVSHNFIQKNSISVSKVAFFTNIDIGTCQQINKALGLPFPPAFDWYNGGLRWVGTYSNNGNGIPDDGGPMTSFYGEDRACLGSYTSPPYWGYMNNSAYFYYHVLMSQ